jgi:hypothetical protein
MVLSQIRKTHRAMCNQHHMDVLAALGYIGLLPGEEIDYDEPYWQGQPVFTAIPVKDHRSDVRIIPLQKEDLCVEADYWVAEQYFHPF